MEWNEDPEHHSFFKKQSTVHKQVRRAQLQSLKGETIYRKMDKELNDRENLKMAPAALREIVEELDGARES